MGEVQDFMLTESDGKNFSKSDLRGKVWIANFILTRCQGPCPILSSRMAGLQKEVHPETALVSFSVDPEYDTPVILSLYAQNYRARANWFFLTGNPADIRNLLRNSFHVGTEGTGPQMIHSLLFALVDAQGKIRGYYNGTDLEEIKRISRDAKILHAEKNFPWTLSLPNLNAFLNMTSAILLISGFHFIRNKKILQHKICMGTAFLSSTLFLVSYLCYHGTIGSYPFLKSGWIRPVYFTLLISHTVLAAMIAPLVLITLRRAWKNDFLRHKQIARWTLPVWLYVSVSGLTVYWMLYRMG
ncbi:MAG: DUF420 domain-containing protein, partial [Elusimicrobia bacterium]|nr:DUF420 domain-containing protein [Elusimicrobiota bacterium]